MRQWMNLLETKHFVGTCVNSFDEEGDCMLPELPWSTVSDLAIADEEANQIEPYQFQMMAPIPSELSKSLAGHDVRYLEHDGVYMLYDADEDIHYFFV